MPMHQKPLELRGGGTDTREAFRRLLQRDESKQGLRSLRGNPPRLDPALFLCGQLADDDSGMACRYVRGHDGACSPVLAYHLEQAEARESSLRAKLGQVEAALVRTRQDLSAVEHLTMALAERDEEALSRAVLIAARQLADAGLDGDVAVTAADALVATLRPLLADETRSSATRTALDERDCAMDQVKQLIAKVRGLEEALAQRGYADNFYAPQLSQHWVTAPRSYTSNTFTLTASTPTINLPTPSNA